MGLKAAARWLLLSGLCGGCFGNPVSALAGPSDHGLGPVFSGHIEVAGKQVPLPDGAWTVIGHGHGSRRNPASEAFGAIRTVVLGSWRDGRVQALAIVNTNTISVARGWLYGDPCLDHHLHFSDVVGNATDGACVLVTHVLSAARVDASDAWVQALETAATAGLDLPSTWLSVRFSVADRADFVDVRYYFNPELRGFGPVPRDRWRDNAWHRSQVPAGSDKAAFIDTLVTWALGLRPFVRDGLRRRLDNGRPIPWPWTLTGTAIPPALAEKLYKLEELRALGAIDEAQFQAQTELILTTAVDDAGDGVSAWVKALAKTVSWRAVASADTLMISYLLTGDVRTAGSIAALEVGSKLAAYFGHEMLWDALLTPDNRPANPIELESAGIDRPQALDGAVGWGALLLSWLPFGSARSEADTAAATRAALSPAADRIVVGPTGGPRPGMGTGQAGARPDGAAVPAALVGPVQPTEQRVEVDRFLGVIPMDWLP